MRKKPYLNIIEELNVLQEKECLAKKKKKTQKTQKKANKKPNFFFGGKQCL